MSTATVTTRPVSSAPGQLWIAQIRAIVGIELKRTLWMRRSVWIYLIALGPALLVAVHALNSPLGRYCTLGEDTNILAYIFQLFYLRVGIFFGCMGLFTWLFRGDVVEKHLHYYFLAPLRREVLVVGKFLAGAIG